MCWAFLWISCVMLAPYYWKQYPSASAGQALVTNFGNLNLTGWYGEILKDSMQLSAVFIEKPCPAISLYIHSFGLGRTALPQEGSVIAENWVCYSGYLTKKFFCSSESRRHFHDRFLLKFTNETFSKYSGDESIIV